jgi:hypothetical protein
MSGINGDKARFNRRRKQKIALRHRNRGRFVPEQSVAQQGVAPKKPKERTA